MSNMNEEGDEDRFRDTGTAREKSSSILKASALCVITCALVALIGWSSSATEPANSSRSLGEWHTAPPQVYSSEDEERFKEVLKPAEEREWDEIQCVQTEASAACKSGKPDFWLFVYGPYDGMDCESLAILKNVAEWQIEAAEPWRAHCRERPDAPHLPYPTVPAHDSVEQKVVCLSSAEEEILFDDWETAEDVGFDLSRCSLQERVEHVVDMPSDAERPLCLGQSADTAVFDTLRFTLWDYYWLRGDIQAMWQYGDEDEWRTLSESCSAQSRRLDPYTDNCPGSFAHQANWRANFSITKINSERSHFHWHANQDTMRGLQFSPLLSNNYIKPCPSNKPANAGEGASGWARPTYKKGASHRGVHNIRGWYCDESPKTWVRFRAAFSGSLTFTGSVKDQNDPPTCDYEILDRGYMRIMGKGSSTCHVDLKLSDPMWKVREWSATRDVCRTGGGSGGEHE